MTQRERRRKQRELERRLREIGIPEPEPEPPLTRIYSKTSPYRGKGRWTSGTPERGSDLS